MSGQPQRNERIDALLAEHAELLAPSNGEQVVWGRASEHPCEGAKFHSPAPLTTSPLAVGPGDTRVWLCPTCMSKLDTYLALAEIAPEAMTWPVRQEFGNQIRMLGQRLTEAGRAS